MLTKARGVLSGPEICKTWDVSFASLKAYIIDKMLHTMSHRDSEEHLGRKVHDRVHSLSIEYVAQQVSALQVALDKLRAYKGNEGMLEGNTSWPGQGAPHLEIRSVLQLCQIMQ